MNESNQKHQPSEAQIRANRENARRSTGPRTAEGKAASSRNSLKHGLCAEINFLPSEDPQEFEALLDDLYSRFHPQGEAEQKQVHRIATCQWRLDRVFPMEAGIYRERFRDVARHDDFRASMYIFKKEEAEENGQPIPREPETPLAEDLPARAFNADVNQGNAFPRLARYESSIERSLDRAMRQLKNLQQARQQQPQIKNDETKPIPASKVSHTASEASGQTHQPPATNHQPREQVSEASDAKPATAAKPSPHPPQSPPDRP